MSAEPPVNFTTEAERQKWITDHADYFTIVRRVKLQNIRHTSDSLLGARETARELIAQQPGTRWLIYAVYRNHDTYVETVK